MSSLSRLVPLVLFVACLTGCVEHSPEANAPAVSSGDADPVAAHSEMPASESGGSSKVQEPSQVVIDNFRFSPRELTVPAGTKVTWVNRDDVPHTATSQRKPSDIDSGTLDTDDRYTHVFTAPGTYEYFCAVHPHMTGKIIVK